MEKKIYLLAVIEAPIWAGSPLGRIVDILNYACADWNSHKPSLHKDWQEHLRYFMRINNIEGIKSEHPDNLGKPFFMGFGGSHFFVHDMNDKRAYLIGAREFNPDLMTQ